MGSFLDVARPKSVGVDIFDNPIRAVERKMGRFLEEDLEKFYNQISDKYKDEELKKVVINSKYLGECLIIHMMFKHVIKKLGPNIVKPSLMVCLPTDIHEGQFGELFKRMIEEAAIEAGAKRVRLIESLVCAATGSDVPFMGLGEAGVHEKILYVYSNSRATCISLLFAGAIIATKVIEKNYNDISIQLIDWAIEQLIKDTPHDITHHFEGSKIPQEEMSLLYRSWNGSISAKVYLSVPNTTKARLGYNHKEYRLIYTDNYEDCIILGLEKALGFIEHTKINNRLI